MKFTFNMFRLRARTLPIVLLACCAGCGKSGPPIAAVSGTVTLDGAPLTEGVVGFVSASGYVSSAHLGPDGHFRQTSQYGPGIPLGEYRVTVLPSNPDLNEMSMMSKQPLRPSKIPTKYQYPDRSGLSATVDNGPTEFIFKLTSVK